MSRVKVDTYDLKELVRELGGHADRSMLDEYQAQCRNCGEWIGQTQDHCYGCDARVAWKGSKVWDDKYRIPREPALEQLLHWSMQRSFKDGVEYHRWQAVKEILTATEVSETLKWVEKAMRGKPRSPRGMIRFGLNALEQKAFKKEPESDDDIPDDLFG